MIVGKIACAIVTVTMGGASAYAAPFQRTDLSSKLAAPLCEDGGNLTHLQLWEKQVFDAQIQGFRVRPKGHKKLTERALAIFASKQADEVHHNGYATGICKDGSGWYLTTPAATATTIDPPSILVDGITLHHSCREIYLDFGPESETTTRSLPPPLDDRAQQWNINSKFLGRGSLSVTCLPKTPEWGGPVLWTLVPIDAATMRPPSNFNHREDIPAPERLLAWVNELRMRAKLPTLIGTRELDDAAADLAKKVTTSHDRRDLTSIRRRLASRGIGFLGENRAIGKTLDDITWLFWASPRHRQLLLDPVARQLGIAWQSDKRRNFVVFATGNNVPLATSKRDR